MVNASNFKICVIGAGSWGTAIAKYLAEKGLDIVLWAREPEVVHSILNLKENLAFLPDIKLPENIRPTNDLKEVLAEKNFVIFSVPSKHLRSVLKNAARFIASGSIVVNTSKGIEADTGKLMQEVFDDELGLRIHKRYATISGPTFAREVAVCLPTRTAIAAWNEKTGKAVREVFEGQCLGVELTKDVVGVELGGALKNVVAIAVGMAGGLGFGDNAKSVIATKGMEEMTRLGVRMGANALTFSGQAGFGDLVLTCMGKLSRNGKLGQRIGQGERLEDIMKSALSVAEGVTTVVAVKNLAKQYRVLIPVTNQVYLVLYESKLPREAMLELITA